MLCIFVVVFVLLSHWRCYRRVLEYRKSNVERNRCLNHINSSFSLLWENTHTHAHCEQYARLQDYAIYIYGTFILLSEHNSNMFRIISVRRKSFGRLSMIFGFVVRFWFGLVFLGGPENNSISYIHLQLFFFFSFCGAMCTHLFMHILLSYAR